MEDDTDAPMLQLQTMIGFGGSVPMGLQVHPDGKHLIYPVGCTVVIEHIATKKQSFLSGHSNTVSCVTVSKTGRFMASGQVTDMGFKADIIIWDYELKEIYCKLTLHRNCVEALAFSPNDFYLASLGGEDDGSVVVWNVAKKEAICGSPAQAPSSGLTHALTYSNTDDNVFITGGKDTLRIWHLSTADRKIRPTEINTGSIKRIVRFIKVSADDKMFYCGTTSGDLLGINMVTNTFSAVGPEKDRFSQGVTALCLLPSGELIVGAGDGTIGAVGGLETRFKRKNKQQKLAGSITSISAAGQQLWVGTSDSNIYQVAASDLSAQLRTTCHNGSVNDIAFPHECGDLLATASNQEIRIWYTKKGQELLRIPVANMKCNAVAIMCDGKSIVSGWGDGRVRGFYPESGREFYIMDKAYGSEVTAIETLSDCRHVISGSNLGHVVVWQVPAPSDVSAKSAPLHVSRHFLLKEHKAAVTCIRACRRDTECITSSVDGSCIIWDLINKCRRQMIRVNTLFKDVCYHPKEHQVLTTGTDRKVAYWETYDASAIRELDGSQTVSVNALDISRDGTYFVSGGDDKMIKVWLYDEGAMTHIGVGHSAPVTRVKISPDEKHIISASSDGAIIRWKFPHRPTFIEHDD